MHDIAGISTFTAPAWECLPLESEEDNRVCAARDHSANLDAFLWTLASLLKLASLSLCLKAKQFGCRRHVDDSCLRAFHCYLE